MKKSNVTNTFVIQGIAFDLVTWKWLTEKNSGAPIAICLVKVIENGSYMVATLSPSGMATIALDCETQDLALAQIHITRLCMSMEQKGHMSLSGRRWRVALDQLQ